MCYDWWSRLRAFVACTFFFLSRWGRGVCEREEVIPGGSFIACVRYAVYIRCEQLGHSTWKLSPRISQYLASFYIFITTSPIFNHFFPSRKQSWYLAIPRPFSQAKQSPPFFLSLVGNQTSRYLRWHFSNPPVRHILCVCNRFENQHNITYSEKSPFLKGLFFSFCNHGGNR